MGEYKNLQLKDVVSSIKGGGTPSRTVSRYWNGEIPWATVKDFSDRKIVLLDTEEHITTQGLINSSSNLIDAGTVLVCTRISVGRSALTTRQTAINQDIKAIYLNELVSPVYLNYLLIHNRGLLESVAVGSTVKGVKLSQLLEMPIVVPSRPTQECISSILTKIDAAIEQTRESVKKQKRIWRGLIQELFTKGIDANGQIRDENRHKFKETSIGRIPDSWNVVSFGEFLNSVGGIIQTGPFGSQLHAYEYVSEGVPVIMPQDIIDGEASTESIARITESKAESLKRHRTHPNDIILARRGDLSRVLAVGKLETGWLCGSGCLLLRAPGLRLDSKWFSYLYSFHRVQTQINAMAVGSIMPNLNRAIISSLLIPIPSIDEQRSIVEILRIKEREIRRTNEQVSKLEALRRGLMHDLLTGKTPVSNVLGA